MFVHEDYFGEFADGVRPLDRVDIEQSLRHFNPDTTVSIWFDKEYFPNRSDASRWLATHGHWKRKLLSTPRFWVAAQNEHLKSGKNKGKIRSKYIREGILIRFLPAMYVTRNPFRTPCKNHDPNRNPTDYTPGQVRTICSYCHKILKMNIEDPPIFSHGICKSRICSEKFLGRKLDDEDVKELGIED